jgi:L-fuculose-phosphate aldolase
MERRGIHLPIAGVITMTMQVSLEAPSRAPRFDLSPAQELALMARSLHKHGYDDHNLGHISYRQPDDTLLVTPFELGWEEIRASDVMRIDLNGSVLDGVWSVTPAIQLHLVLHRARPDVVVGIHHHPRWGTVWAAAGRIPAAYDQGSSYLRSDRIGFLDEYVGPVTSGESSRTNIDALADNDATFLANHGVLVVGRSVQAAHLRATMLEHRCHQAWKVEVLGGGRAMPDAAAKALADAAESSDLRSGHQFWYMVRKLIRQDSSVLD